MDRRSFLRIGTTAVVAAGMPQIAASAAQKPQDVVLGGSSDSSGLRVRFHGTGAAGGRREGKGRRQSSVLLDSRILIDLTANNFDMIPEGCSPEIIFYTHSHGDHYHPASAIKAGVKQVFVSETWVSRAREDFKAAAGGGAVPTITPLSIGQKVTAYGITITAMPGNHATADAEEQALIYLLEKDGARVIYATDTGGIPVRAARIAGIDAHIKEGNPITALIMEATMASDEDFRIYTHSSTGVVLRTAHVLQNTGRMTPPDGQVPVVLTHMADSLHEGETVPAPLLKAYDGMEVVFTAPGRTLKVGSFGDHWYDASFDGFNFGEAVAHDAADPAYLAPEHDGLLYCASERQGHSGAYSFKGGECTGFVAIQDSNVPCHIMHPEGLPYVCMADYTGGSVSVISLDSEGRVSTLAQTFSYGPKAHCHQMKEIPSDICRKAGIIGRWVFATDLGLSRIHVFEALGDGLKDVSAVKCPTGPRHMEFNREHGLLYVLTELSDELIVFSIGSRNGRPLLKEISRQVAADIEGHGGADIHLHPSGRYLYTSHRLVNDGVAIFSIDSAGMPVKIGYQCTGAHPRNFTITPDGLSLLVACRDTSSVEAYRIKEEGLLSKIAEKTFDDKPVCLDFG